MIFRLLYSWLRCFLQKPQKNRRRSRARCLLHLQHLRPKRHVVGEASRRCIRGAGERWDIEEAKLWGKPQTVLTLNGALPHQDRQRCYRCPRRPGSCGRRFPFTICLQQEMTKGPESKALWKTMQSNNAILQISFVFASVKTNVLASMHHHASYIPPGRCKKQTSGRWWKIHSWSGCLGRCGGKRHVLQNTETGETVKEMEIKIWGLCLKIHGPGAVWAISIASPRWWGFKFSIISLNEKRIEASSFRVAPPFV